MNPFDQFDEEPAAVRAPNPFDQFDEPAPAAPAIAAPPNTQPKELYRPSIIPLRRGADGDIEFVMPQIIAEPVNAITKAMEDVRAGDFDAMKGSVSRAGVEVAAGATGAGMVTRAPRQAALAMNAMGPPLKAGARAATQSVKETATAIAPEIILDRFGPADAAAGRVMLKRITDTFPNMTPEEAIAKAQAELKRLGPDAIPADIGEPIAYLARNMAQGPGQSSKRAGDVIRARRAEEKTAVIDSIKKNVSDKEFYDVEKMAMLQRRRSAPFFEKAFAEHDNVSNDKLRLVLEQEPDVKKAMDRGLKIERGEASERGEKFDPGTFGVITDFNSAGDPIITQMQRTPLRLWHSTKRGLDAMIAERKNLLGQLDPQDVEANRLIGLRKTIDDEIKTATGGGKGTYARANALATDGYRLEDALERGRRFAKGDEEITAKTFKALPPKEKDAFRAGVARYMIQKIRDNAGDQTPAEIMSAINKEASVRRKLEVIAPTKDQYNRFLADIQNRLHMRATNAAIKNVPATGSILMQEGAAASDALENVSTGGAIALDLGRGNVPAAISKAVQWGVGALSRLRLPQETRDKIGKLLLSQDQTDQDEAFRLIREAQANKRPPGR